MQLRDRGYFIHTAGEMGIVFEISDEDISGDPQYFGYLDQDGSWLIHEYNIAAGTHRYIVGTEDYSANWAAKAGLTYVLYSALASGA